MLITSMGYTATLKQTFGIFQECRVSISLVLLQNKVKNLSSNSAGNTCIFEPKSTQAFHSLRQAMQCVKQCFLVMILAA